MRLALVVLVASLAAPFTVAAEEPTPAERAREILDRVDDLWRGSSSRGVMQMRVVTRHYERSLELEAWSRGKEHSLVRVRKPKKEAGMATLKAENSIYTYLPKTDRTIRITSGMMMGSWMGSHFTNDDLVKESRLSEDYEAIISFEGERDGVRVLDFTLTPHPDAAVVWGRIEITVQDGWGDHPEALIPLRQVYYDEDGAVSRTQTLSDVQVVQDRVLPTSLRMVPADEEGEYTEIRYGDLAFDIEIDDGFFSLAQLRRR